MKWNYTKSINSKDISKLEEKICIHLPEDFKKYLPSINAGKPPRKYFDISGRKECELDYMLDLTDIAKYYKEFKRKSLLPIATDPFGNFICYKIIDQNELADLVFWDHESKTCTYIATSFSEFVEMLYE